MIIGIDPDVNESGLAFRIDDIFSTYTVPLPELINDLIIAKPDIKQVRISAGWLNKSNYNAKGHSAMVAARIGQHTGANHQVGKIIAEFCEYHSIPYKLFKPTVSKPTALFIKQATGIWLPNKAGKHSEMRDALMLCLG